MKAVLLPSYGGPEVLRFAEVDRPVPAAGQVLIRVTAVGVNPADPKWRAGMFRTLVPLRLPVVPGYDIAGVVEQTNGDCGLAPGRRVAAMLPTTVLGAYAQFAVADAALVAPIPPAVDDAAAAAIPTPGLTGVQLIEDQLDVQPGQVVLITGALGAVGRFALGAARARGAHVIAAVRESQREAVAALGADETMALGEPGPERALDAVIDTVGGSEVAMLCRQVRAQGRIVTTATTPIPAEGLAVEPYFYAVHPDAQRLARLLAETSVHFAQPVARTMKLREAAEAHRLIERGGVGGKIILLPWT